MTTLRRLAVPLGIVTAVLLALLFNPWVVLEEGTQLRTAITIAFWVSFIALLVILFEDRRSPEADEVEIEGPRFVRFLFNNSRAGLFWLPIRLFLGFAWLDAGWHKLSDPTESRAAPRSGPTGSERWRSPSRGGRRSRTSGTAISSKRCSPPTRRAGWPGW